MMLNKINLKKVLYIIIPLIIVAGLVVRLKSNKAITEKKVYQYNKEEPVNVETEKVILQSIGNKFLFSGTFEPNRESKLSAESQGKINEIFADLGQIVNKGQLLIQLDNTLLQQQMKAVDVQIEGLEADVKRYKILSDAEAVQGLQLEKAVLGLKSAIIQKATIAEQINKTKIIAPFSGIITAKQTEIGSFAAPGVPLLQLSEIEILRFTINVSEKDLPYFSLDQSYKIKLDAFPEVSITGKILMVGSKSNMGSSFPIQFAVNNIKDNIIKAGMFGKVEIASNDNLQGFVIPASAIVGSSDQAQVYTVKNNKALLKKVTVSKGVENKVVISEGLKEGDIIITNGLNNLFEGANIRIK